MRNILIVAGGIVAVAAIVAGVYFGTRSAPPGPEPQAVAATPDKTALLAIQPTDHVLGDPKAPVTLIEYASFTCPHCAHFDTQILPELKKKWIDSGKVKLIYRDFPLSHDITFSCFTLERRRGRKPLLVNSFDQYRKSVDRARRLVRDM